MKPSDIAALEKAVMAATCSNLVLTKEGLESAQKALRVLLEQPRHVPRWIAVSSGSTPRRFSIVITATPGRPGTTAMYLTPEGSWHLPDGSPCDPPAYFLDTGIASNEDIGAVLEASGLALGDDMVSLILWVESDGRFMGAETARARRDLSQMLTALENIPKWIDACNRLPERDGYFAVRRKGALARAWFRDRFDCANQYWENYNDVIEWFDVGLPGEEHA